MTQGGPAAVSGGSSEWNRSWLASCVPGEAILQSYIYSSKKSFCLNNTVIRRVFHVVVIYPLKLRICFLLVSEYLGRTYSMYVCGKNV